MAKQQSTLLFSLLTLLCAISLSACNIEDSSLGNLEPEPINDPDPEKTPDPKPGDGDINTSQSLDSGEVKISFQTKNSEETTVIVKLPVNELPIADTKFEGGITVTVAPPPVKLEEVEVIEPGIILPPPYNNRYETLTPHPELFCAFSKNDAFEKIAKQLGGYKKGSQIYIEPDAASPTILDGIEPLIYRLETTEMASVDASAVSIQRPNTLVRKGSQAFYLSDIYGLITLDFDETASTPVQLSCALPLPGRPLNFVITEKSLIVLVQSINRLHTGIIQLSLNNFGKIENEKLAAPVFKDALFFKNQEVLDARLFNQTLALYVKKYRIRTPIIDEIKDEDISREPVSATRPVAAKPEDSGSVQNSADAISSPGIYMPRIVENHQLKVIATTPDLALKYTQVFDSNDKVLRDPSIDRWNSYFNEFLSASGEYLVVTEGKTRRYISHYEKRRAYRCTEYKLKETPYEYCSTQWKRTENPDYIEPDVSGVIDCKDDLLSCLTIQLPTVNRYIYVPDGEKCVSGVYTKRLCVAGNYEEYQVPVYKYDRLTDFYVFRFKDGGFHKLDNTLAELEDDKILITDKPFQLSGHVKKHDHLNFRGNQFYAITDDTKSTQLHSLTIIRNAAILTNSQKVNRSSWSSELAANFTKKRIYLSQSNYSYILRHQVSELQTFTLADPLKPKLIEEITIPTRLEQLFFNDNYLLGIGSTYFGRTTARNFVGTITGFSVNGEELNSLVLGSDYRYYRSQANYDDQVISFDRNLNRLLFPYSASQPISDLNGPPEVNRLTISDMTDDGVVEEHTFSLPGAPSRTLSVDADLAFSFSDEYIHYLGNDGAWNSKLIFNGEIPDSIYYSRKHPTQVQKTIRPDKLLFKLIDAKDGASGLLLDRVAVTRSSSSICVQERVYFDQDRILIVQEESGIYFSYEDCPDRWQNAKILLTGYKIDATNLTEIDDKDELKKLYYLINWDMQCITNIENLDGKRLDALPENVDKLSCYTRDQYSELRAEERLPLAEIAK